MNPKISKTFIVILALTWFNCAQASEPDQAAEFAQHAEQNMFTLFRSDSTYSGAGWEFLLKEGRAAQFFLLGEEHGIAENPPFSAALFDALTESGYAHFAIEISPQMAMVLEQQAAQGLPAVKTFFTQPNGKAAFFGMLEEAEMLVRIMQAAGSDSNVLWGLDYEVLGDVYLIEQLASEKKPAKAQSAFVELLQQARETGARFAQTRNPADIFSFSADPKLVEAVIDAWPEADRSAAELLYSLKETYHINQLWMSGNGWLSNHRRAELLRHNLLNHWRSYQNTANKPKVFFKFGSSHMIRGPSSTDVYDLGSLLPELATVEGGQAFQLLVLPGRGSMTAVFNPVTMEFAASTPKDSYAVGLERLTELAPDGKFTVFDLRALRPLARSGREFLSPELTRVIHGYDALLIMNGSTASQNLLQ